MKRQISRIESETGLTLPANSRLDHFFEREVFVDPIWVAKVLIPESSYENFKQALLTKPTDKTDYTGALADSTSWWKPINVILKKQYWADSHHFLVNVVVSKEDGGFAVYIECACF